MKIREYNAQIVPWKDRSITVKLVPGEEEKLRFNGEIPFDSVGEYFRNNTDVKIVPADAPTVGVAPRCNGKTYEVVMDAVDKINSGIISGAVIKFYGSVPLRIERVTGGFVGGKISPMRYDPDVDLSSAINRCDTVDALMYAVDTASDSNDLFRKIHAGKIASGKFDSDTIREMYTPEKIFRCRTTTTVLWKDGSKTIVNLDINSMEDSAYGAFTAALAKKIFGTNSEVNRVASMVQRVKSKAEKKAEKKAKEEQTAEPEPLAEEPTIEAGCKWYKIARNGLIVEVTEDAPFDAPFASDAIAEGYEWFCEKSETAALMKAARAFAEKYKAYYVRNDGREFKANESYLFSGEKGTDGVTNAFGEWRDSHTTAEEVYTYVFADSEDEAIKLAKEIPRE